MNPVQPLQSARAATLLAAILGAVAATAAPGDLRWSVTVPGLVPAGSALDAQGRVVAAWNGTLPTDPGRVTRIDAAGNVVASRPTGTGALRPPAVRPDEAALLLGPGGLLQVVPASPGGDLAWQLSGTLAAPAVTADSSVVVTHETVLGNRRVVRFAPSGAVAASVDLAPIGTTIPVVPRNLLLFPDGTAVSPSSGSPLSYADLASGWNKTAGTNFCESIAPAPGDGVYGAGPAGLARIESDGRPRWILPLERIATAPVVAPSGLVIVGRRDAGLVAVTPDGAVAWSVDVPGGVESTPAVAADGSVCFGGNDGSIRAVSSSGAPLWRRDAGSPSRIAVSILPDGGVVAGTDDGRLLCVEGASPLASQGWPKWQGDAANSGRVPGVAAAPPVVAGVAPSDRGGVVVRWDGTPGARRYEVWRSAVGPVFAGATRITDNAAPGFVDAGFASGATNWYWIRARNGAGPSAEGDATPILPTRRLWRVQPFASLAGIAEMPDGRVVGAGADPANGRPIVVALNADGTTSWKWAKPTNTGKARGPMVDRDGNVVVGIGRRLVTLAPDGQEVSSIDGFVDLAGPMALGPGGLVYCLGTSGAFVPVLAFDRAASTATQVASIQGTLGLDTIAVAGDGRVVVGGGLELRAIAPAGNRLWSFPRVGRTLLPGGRTLLVGRTNFSVVDADGAVVRELQVPGVHNPPPTSGTAEPPFHMGVVDAAGTAWFSNGLDLMRLDPDGTARLLPPLQGPGGRHHSLALGAGGRLVLARQSGVDVIGADGVVTETLLGLASGLSDFGVPAVLSASGRLYIGSDLGIVSCASMPFGGDPTAFWQGYRGDARNASSVAAPAPVAPRAVASAFAVRSPDGVRVRWSNSGDWAWQEVLRAADGDLAHATSLGVVSPVVVRFDDPAPAGPAARYWIRASNSAGVATSPLAVAVPPAPPLRARIPTANGTVPPGLALDDDGTVLVGMLGGRLRAWTRDGAGDWSAGYVGLPGQAGTPRGDAGGGWIVSNPSGSERIASRGTDVSPATADVFVARMPGGRVLWRGKDGVHRVLDAAGRGFAPAFPAGSTPFPMADAAGGLYVLTADWAVARFDGDGRESWRAALTRRSTAFTPAPDGAIAPDGSLAVVTGSSGIAWIDASGTVRWERAEEALEPVLDGAGAVLVRWKDGDGRTRLRSVSAADGAVRWAFDAADATGAATALADGTVVVPCNTTVYGLDGATGAVRWATDLKASSDSSPGGGVTGLRVNARGDLAVQALSRDLFVFDAGAGPAASGWPMTGHDSRNTGLQGGDVAREVTARRGVGADGKSPVLRVSATDGGPFLPLASDDLATWRLLPGASWEDEVVQGGQGTTTRRVLRVDAAAAGARFVKAVAP